MSEYLPRIADTLIERKLAYAGAVVVRGPKWCGKTAACLQQAASALMMQDPDAREGNLLLAETKPSVLLRGKTPRLIDEWQEAPQLWDAVRFAVDRSAQPGQFLLTGSATPAEAPRHSGAGRMSFVDMRPMSLFESRESSGEVSLSALFEGASEVGGRSDLDVESLAHVLCRGGWPASVVARDGQAALEMAYDYVSVIAEEDISRVDGVFRNATYARTIMRAYARCTATQASIASMRSDIKRQGNELSKDTVGSYIAALRNLYVIEDLDAWAPSLHAKSRIATTPVRHFSDPSVAVAALGASPESLLRDMSTYGLLFESLCVRDLRVYVGAASGSVMHYRDNTGLEADAVVMLRDGRYGLIEVKMSARLIEEGATNLRRVSEKVDQGVMGKPSFCMVLTPGGYAYTRSDGIHVVPIGCLKH